MEPSYHPCTEENSILTREENNPTISENLDVGFGKVPPKYMPA